MNPHKEVWRFLSKCPHMKCLRSMGRWHDFRFDFWFDGRRP